MDGTTGIRHPASGIGMKNGWNDRHPASGIGMKNGWNGSLSRTREGVEEVGRGMGRLTVVNHAGAAVVLEVQKKGGRCHSHLWILGEAPDEPTSKLRPTNYFTLGELSKGGKKERGG